MKIELTAVRDHKAGRETVGNQSKITGKGCVPNMAEGRKKILFVVEAMGGGVFTYIVDRVCMNDCFEIEVKREAVAA